jgi:triacylglycerol lipase
MKASLLVLLSGLLAALPSAARETRVLRVSKPKNTVHLPLADPVGRVVLVPGFLETGSSFRWMTKRLSSQGYECLVPRFRPSDGRQGLENLAEDLKREIEAAFGPEEPFSIIAFSMGGLVSRYYLQQLGGAERCQKLFTISSPHNGTLVAHIYPGQGANQMRPGSGFLTQLAETEPALGKMPVVSYRTPMDLIILPASSSVWQRAENFEFPVLLHPLMLTSRPVMADIERRLAGG